MDRKLIQLTRVHFLISSLSLSPGPIYITSYTLHGLQPASLFEVSVLARNSFGWSDNSRIVRFATGGEGKFPT